MNAETDRVLRVPDSTSALEPSRSAWRRALPLTVLAIAAILALYWRTAESIVAIWWRSETFAHGFLIVPIALYLIWRRRGAVAALAPSPDPLGLMLLAGAGAAWLVAGAGQAQVVQQYALVAMIPAAVIAVAGREVARALAFPLGFLFLGVPVGEALILPLMNWTADFTVTALRLTGIPVLREGTFFTIPSGSWSIVEGCSGLRYLIASITVGTLFAYLSYQSMRKRLLFVATSVVVPIIANGLRAYMIVMIAHLSDMRLALGVDHFIYGWLFFGLVMLLLFWIGSFWRDEPQEASAASAQVGRQPSRRSRGGMAGYAVGVVAIAAAWPAYAAYLDRGIGEREGRGMAAPAGASGWVADAADFNDWRPHYDPASASLFQVYRKGGERVALYIAYYRHQRPGAQLVDSQNYMIVQKHPVWSNVGESGREEDLGRGAAAIRETLLRSTGQRLLIWDWFRIKGNELTNPYLAKLLLAWGKLAGGADSGAAIILATPYDERRETAEETLRAFARDMSSSIGSALAQLEAGRTETPR